MFFISYPPEKGLPEECSFNPNLGMMDVHPPVNPWSHRTPKNPRDAETALQGKNGADECDFPKETIIQFKSWVWVRI